MPVLNLVLEVSCNRRPHWPNVKDVKCVDRVCHHLHPAIYQPPGSLSATQGTPSIVCKYRGLVVVRAGVPKGGPSCGSRGAYTEATIVTFCYFHPSVARSTT